MTDTGKTILLGMKGDATIQVSAVEGALTIPVEALFNQNGQNYVYKLVGTKLVQTNITLVRRRTRRSKSSAGSGTATSWRLRAQRSTATA